MIPSQLNKPTVFYTDKGNVKIATWHNESASLHVLFIHAIYNQYYTYPVSNIPTIFEVIKLHSKNFDYK